MDFIFIMIALIVGIPVYQKILKITDVPPIAAFGVFIVGVTTSLTLTSIDNIQYYNMQKADMSINEPQNKDAQGIYINGIKTTVQEETVYSQDDSYSILISGTAINPQNINLNDCDFSVDTEVRRITISEKGTEAGVKNMEPYEIHINGSDINIESLNLNDFAITVDEGNRWIVLTEKE